MYEQATSSLTAINCVWRAVVDQPDTYTDSANEYWGIAFTRRPDGSRRAELIGPSLRPRALDGLRGDEYWGVEFRAHVVFAGETKSNLLGATRDLPITDTGRGAEVELGSRWHRIPEYDELEWFVSHLLADGVIISRDEVRRALEGDHTGYSPRSWQRRIRRVTGLSGKQIQQLERARHAYVLLQSGTTPSEAAAMAGYADQAHLTRALRLLHDETPAVIIARHRASTM